MLKIVSYSDVVSVICVIHFQPTCQPASLSVLYLGWLTVFLDVFLDYQVLTELYWLSLVEDNQATAVMWVILQAKRAEAHCRLFVPLTMLVSSQTSFIFQGFNINLHFHS